MKRLWLLFAQGITLAMAVALVYKLLGPEPPPAPPGHVSVTQAVSAQAPGGRLGESFRAAVAKAGPSVVNIYTRRAPRGGPSPLYRYFYGEEPPESPEMSLGSGVIVSERGYVLTNNHVIEGADQIAIVFADGQAVQAKVVGADPETDLAVLLTDLKNPKPIAFAAKDSAQVGDVVLAIGNPFGVGQTVTQGIVSALGRDRLGINTFEDFIQTDAAINPGNSGGALVDIQGNLVGINSAIFSKSGGSQGIGFAIPADLALSVMKQIVETGRVVRGWLGVDIREAKDRGAFIGAIQPRGPAARAGLRAGDLVVGANGAAIADAAGVLKVVAATRPGEALSLVVVRTPGQQIELKIVVGERPRARQAAR